MRRCAWLVALIFVVRLAWRMLRELPGSYTPDSAAWDMTAGRDRNAE